MLGHDERRGLLITLEGGGGGGGQEGRQSGEKMKGNPEREMRGEGEKKRRDGGEKKRRETESEGMLEVSLWRNLMYILHPVSSTCWPG